MELSDFFAATAALTIVVVLGYLGERPRTYWIRPRNYNWYDDEIF